MCEGEAQASSQTNCVTLRDRRDDESEVQREVKQSKMKNTIMEISSSGLSGDRGGLPEIPFK